jgi:nucleotide-binding universal stress UspA family protein
MRGPIDRIIVALDATSESRTVIDTAVRLAAQAKAPLHGIFVENEELLHLASLPFARQVTAGAGAEALTLEDIELQLRAAAERVRTELLGRAKQQRVKCSFEIVRGAAESAASIASEHDLVVAGALARPVAGHFRVEHRWWSYIDATRGPFLLARNVWGSAGSVVMLLRDRNLASARLFDAAAQIAAARESVLTVICPPAISGAEGFEQWIADRVKEHPVRVQIEIAAVEAANLRERLSELDCRLLAFEAALAEGSGDRVRKIVERFACDVLIVR